MGGRRIYSPQICEDLIPRLYVEAKRRGIPMPRLVNHMVESMLKDMEPELLPEVNDGRINDSETVTVQLGVWSRHPEHSRHSPTPDKTRWNLSDDIRQGTGEKCLTQTSKRMSSRLRMAFGFSAPTARPRA